MTAQVEHANITVADLDEAVKFLTTALPDMRVRGGGGEGGNRWVHVGTDDSYLSLCQAAEESAGERANYKQPGLNHIGFRVDSTDAVEERMQKAGYERTLVDDAHPYRKRVYFKDALGNEWEFVEYYSDDPAERNDYSL